MPDLLVRDIDPKLYQRTRKAAELQGMSVTQAAREALAEIFNPSKAEIWARIDALREQIGPVSGDSTDLIRQDRENDEPYR